VGSALQEEQAPIDRAIAEAMVQSVPELWNRIVLELARPNDETGIGHFTHALSSPEGYPTVTPVAELFSATYRLDELFQRHRAVFTRAVYEVTLKPESWSWRASFEYSSNAGNPPTSSGGIHTAA
jgi:hypothetical protein